MLGPIKFIVGTGFIVVSVFVVRRFNCISFCLYYFILFYLFTCLLIHLLFIYFRFSGVKQGMEDGVHTSIYDVQATLLFFIYDKTILIGHCLDSDFKGLKVNYLIVCNNIFLQLVNYIFIRWKICIFLAHVFPHNTICG